MERSVHFSVPAVFLINKAFKSTFKSIKKKKKHWTGTPTLGDDFVTSLPGSVGVKRNTLQIQFKTKEFKTDTIQIQKKKGSLSSFQIKVCPSTTLYLHIKELAYQLAKLKNTNSHSHLYGHYNHLSYVINSINKFC